MKYTSPSNSIDFLELENLESIRTAEPRGPPFTPLKIGFRKWHNSKTALSKPLFKNLHSLKIVSATSTSLKLQLMNRQLLNTQLSNSAARRIVFSKIHFSKQFDSKLTLINYILIKSEFLKVEEAKVRSAISLLGNLIVSLDNFFQTLGY